MSNSEMSWVDLEHLLVLEEAGLGLDHLTPRVPPLLRRTLEVPHGPQTLATAWKGFLEQTEGFAVEHDVSLWLRAQMLTGIALTLDKRTAFDALDTLEDWPELLCYVLSLRGAPHASVPEMLWQGQGKVWHTEFFANVVAQGCCSLWPPAQWASLVTQMASILDLPTSAPIRCHAVLDVVAALNPRELAVALTYAGPVPVRPFLRLSPGLLPELPWTQTTAVEHLL